MYPIYRWLYNQFGFSRSQSNGFLILLPLTLFVVISGPLYQIFFPHRMTENEADIRRLDSLIALLDAPPTSQPRGLPDSLFNFDPNIASTEHLKKLGFSETLATRIRRYVDRGGRFRMRTDLLRIHGMDTALFETIAPYIQLPESAKPQTREPVSAKNLSPPNRKIERFDLNTADTLRLRMVRGVGSKLSLRIVKYRDALGGFCSLDQLHEVYALDSSKVRELSKFAFIAPGFQPVKININTAGRQELANHPYFSPRQAGSIVAYRFTHGNFASIEDLGKIGAIDSTTFQRVQSYLTVD